VRKLGPIALLVLASFAGAAAQENTLRHAAPAIAVAPPKIALIGLDTAIGVQLDGFLETRETAVEIRDASGSVLARGMLAAGSATSLTLQAVRSPGPYHVFLPEWQHAGEPFELRVIPGWLTLLPPLLAIALALLFRQVVPALLAGIWIGAWTVAGGPLSGGLRTIDGYIVDALTDPDHVAIVVFTLLLGGMVGVISRSGGTLGLVEVLARRATTPRRGQLTTWAMGLLVFFDDYANTLLVGNTMRPVTDRLRISREKLAYIVDSTAAPVAAIALVSTWIGYEVSLIGDKLEDLGSDRNPYILFLQSLPYNFYPILALVFGLLVAWTMRDWGPMLKAERRAWSGQVLADGAVPLADFDSTALAPPEGKPRRWINAALPVGLVLVVTFLSLWITGRNSLLADGDAFGSVPFWKLGMEGLGGVFSAGASFDSLLYGSMAGCLAALALALGQRIVSLADGLTAWVNGMKSMMVAMVILVLAWSIGDACQDLQTGRFIADLLSDSLHPGWLPAMTFLLAAVIAFSTGTSWGTMALLIPFAIEAAFGVTTHGGLDAAATDNILFGTVSSVLAGALFGDHCSPISDTTVLSSMSSGCDHVDHVRTQLPYALVVAGVALVLGYVPAGFGLNPLICLGLGAAALFGLLRLLGRRVVV
jgi:Na+/H+ antiporter NhaC